jgi:hypothetical protein
MAKYLGYSLLGVSLFLLFAFFSFSCGKARKLGV